VHDFETAVSSNHGIYYHNSPHEKIMVSHRSFKRYLSDCKLQYRLFVRSITENVKVNVCGVLGATSTISELLTTEAIRNEMKWPFVTLSSFEVYVEHTSARSSAEAVVVCPFVTKENLKRWSNYAVNHQGWIAEGFNLHDANGNVTVESIIPIVYHMVGQSDGTQTIVNDLETCCDDQYPVMPVWQMSPPPTIMQMINYNLMSADMFKVIYDNMHALRGPFLGTAGPNPFNGAAQIQTESRRMAVADERYVEGWDDDGHPVQQELNGLITRFPHSSLTYPIFEKPHDPNSTIVGIISSVIAWDNYIRRILPAGISGFYCVLHNSCGQAYTFVMDRPRVVLLGEGDFHDPQYDNYKVEVDVAHEWGLDHEAFSGGVGVDVCSYWMSFYPSDELRESTQNKSPQMFSVLVAFSFVVMGATFVIYTTAW
jgi:hypothetical protein